MLTDEELNFIETKFRDAAVDEITKALERLRSYEVDPAEAVFTLLINMGVRLSPNREPESETDSWSKRHRFGMN
jgi:hypothetical protein